MSEYLASMLRYGVKGAGATVANVTLMSGFVELAGLRPAVAAIVSTCLLLVVGYVVMNKWVFRDAQTPDSHLRRGIQYYAVILSGKGVNYVLFVGLLSVGVWYPLAWVLGSGVAFLGTFTGNRYLWEGTLA